MDKEKIARLPDAPGVYIFKDSRGSILYIGKASSLRKRVKYYLARPLPRKLQIMVSKISGLDYIVCASESEAMIKEAALIREKLPPYNSIGRDDKSFPIIYITDEDFPVVGIARGARLKLPKPALRLFGPYTEAGLLREALKVLRAIFSFRSCRRMPRKSCLYYRLGSCPGPCVRKISRKQYWEGIKNIIMFLEGRRNDLINKLTARMHKLSAQRRFEAAALLRNQIQALSSIVHPLAVPPAVLRGRVFKDNGLSELKKALALTRLPKIIEAFDVSNISGSEAVASMVSFYEGRPNKSNYRRFRIKGVSQINDLKMLQEAVARRYCRVISEHLRLTDLVVIDGGKGQLNAVCRQLSKLGLKIPVISIAKRREEIFIPGQSQPLELERDSPALFLIQRIRDESHRFALAYHRILRRKKIIGK